MPVQKFACPDTPVDAKRNDLPPKLLNNVKPPCNDQKLGKDANGRQFHRPDDHGGGPEMTKRNLRQQRPEDTKPTLPWNERKGRQAAPQPPRQPNEMGPPNELNLAPNARLQTGPERKDLERKHDQTHGPQLSVHLQLQHQNNGAEKAPVDYRALLDKKNPTKHPEDLDQHHPKAVLDEKAQQGLLPIIRHSDMKVDGHADARMTIKEHLGRYQGADVLHKDENTPDLREKQQIPMIADNEFGPLKTPKKSLPLRRKVQESIVHLQALEPATPKPETALKHSHHHRLVSEQAVLREKEGKDEARGAHAPVDEVKRRADSPTKVDLNELRHQHGPRQEAVANVLDHAIGAAKKGSGAHNANRVLVQNQEKPREKPALEANSLSNKGRHTVRKLREAFQQNEADAAEMRIEKVDSAQQEAALSKLKHADKDMKHDQHQVHIPDSLNAKVEANKKKIVEDERRAEGQLEAKKLVDALHKERDNDRTQTDQQKEAARMEHVAQQDARAKFKVDKQNQNQRDISLWLARRPYDQRGRYPAAVTRGLYAQQQRNALGQRWLQFPLRQEPLVLPPHKDNNLYAGGQMLHNNMMNGMGAYPQPMMSTQMLMQAGVGIGAGVLPDQYLDGQGIQSELMNPCAMSVQSAQYDISQNDQPNIGFDMNYDRSQFDARSFQHQKQRSLQFSHTSISNQEDRQYHSNRMHDTFRSESSSGGQRQYGRQPHQPGSHNPDCAQKHRKHCEEEASPRCPCRALISLVKDAEHEVERFVEHLVHHKTSQRH